MAKLACIILAFCFLCCVGAVDREVPPTSTITSSRNSFPNEVATRLARKLQPSVKRKNQEVCDWDSICNNDRDCDIYDRDCECDTESHICIEKPYVPSDCKDYQCRNHDECPYYCDCYDPGYCYNN